MEYYVKVNGLDKIVFKCESEEIRERFILDAPKGDRSKLELSDVEETLFCPINYANSYILEPGIECLTYGDRAKLFWMMDEQFIMDGKLSETYFKNRVIEYVDLISSIIADQDEDYENAMELIEGFLRFHGGESKEEGAMAAIIDMLKYEADLEWCERIGVERNDLEDYFEMYGANFNHMLISLKSELNQLAAAC